MIVHFRDGAKHMADRLGLKGASLCEMAALGLNVPPGFVITTDVFKEYMRLGALPAEVMPEVEKAIREIEKAAGKTYGDPSNPLLLSVRSGAPVMMPGMMDTLLNVGINKDSLAGLAKFGDEKFAYDCYHRFIRGFAETVLGVDRKIFAEIIGNAVTEADVESASELGLSHLKRIIAMYKQAIKRSSPKSVPEDPWEQLRAAVDAIFKSWNTPRAVTYRNLYRIPHDMGTSVTVQAMAFGNLGDNSATGIVMTRDPTTGEKRLFGEYIVRGQGDDILAGRQTPKRVREFKDNFPELHVEFTEVCERIERHFRDMQEVEFTIERGKLYLLQSRGSNRTAAAAIKASTDMVREELITREEALMRIRPESLDQILHRFIDPATQVMSVARGIAASPGAASGRAVFDVDSAEKARLAGEDVILVRAVTTTEDIKGLAAAAGILTTHGGKTSHAAVVARGMGKPCVSGCESIQIDFDKKSFTAGNVTVRENDLITIDGSTGRVFLGTVPMRRTMISPEFRELLQWADETRTLRVRSNADTPEDAAKAREFGAEGIGLCRTEQMLMSPDRLPTVRAMIMAETEDERTAHLDMLADMHRADFLEIFDHMRGLPVTIRLIDPPLHEFLPPLHTLLMEVAVMRSQGVPGEEMRQREELVRKVHSLREDNPMLGLRGCRLGLLYPDITRMQVEAVFQAACTLAKRGADVRPEILIPFVSHVNEVIKVRGLIDESARKIMKNEGVNIAYTVGVLIEIPRAALTAAAIAEVADSFSFGTNDLTQTTFGISRDDAESKFLYYYLDQKILARNPFETIDVDGVGRLIRIAVEDGRRANPNLVTGLSGEQGGERDTVLFCHTLGLDYVSCSTYRLPVARLAAAQAKILENRGELKIEKPKG